MQSGPHFDQKNNAWSSRWHLSYTPVKSSWHKQVLQHKAIMWKQAEGKKKKKSLVLCVEMEEKEEMSVDLLLIKYQQYYIL